MELDLFSKWAQDRLRFGIKMRRGRRRRNSEAFDFSWSEECNKINIIYRRVDYWTFVCSFMFRSVPFCSILVPSNNNVVLAWELQIIQKQIPVLNLTHSHSHSVVGGGCGARGLVSDLCPTTTHGSDPTRSSSHLFFSVSLLLVEFLEVGMVSPPWRDNIITSSSSVRPMSVSLALKDVAFVNIPNSLRCLLRLCSSEQSLRGAKLSPRCVSVCPIWL